MKKRSLIALLATLIWYQYCFADYFYDQGFSDANYRTDFNSKTEGDSSNPLTYASPCAFPPPTPVVAPYSVCASGPTVESVSGDYWYQSSSSVWNTGANFWVLSVNNEPAFDPNTNNIGVPNQVHKLYSNTSSNWMSTPASFAVVTDTPAGENFPRAHLIVRHMDGVHSYDPNGPGGIPFISVGAQKGRGHSSDIGALNSSTRPNTVKFKAKIFGFLEPEPVGTQSDGGLWFFLFAITEWGGKQRGLFINLKHLGDETDWSTGLLDGSKFWWNWPIQESFYYPGIDFAYLDTEDFGGTYNWPYYSQRCLISNADAPAMTSTGVDYQFELDLEELFRCASARGLFQSSMPQYSVLPIKGVHWGVEMNGNHGYIWAAVHDMKMQ